jgi:hypothetical protein
MRADLPISSLASGHCAEETAYSENRHELHETILFSPRAALARARFAEQCRIRIIRGGFVFDGYIRNYLWLYV